MLCTELSDVWLGRSCSSSHETTLCARVSLSHIRFGESWRALWTMGVRILLEIVLMCHLWFKAWSDKAIPESLSKVGLWDHLHLIYYSPGSVLQFIVNMINIGLLILKPVQNKFSVSRVSIKKKLTENWHVIYHSFYGTFFPASSVKLSFQQYVG